MATPEQLAAISQRYQERQSRLFAISERYQARKALAANQDPIGRGEIEANRLAAHDPDGRGSGLTPAPKTATETAAQLHGGYRGGLIAGTNWAAQLPFDVAGSITNAMIGPSKESLEAFPELKAQLDDPSTRISDTVFGQNARAQEERLHQVAPQPGIPDYIAQGTGRAVPMVAVTMATPNIPVAAAAGTVGRIFQAGGQLGAKSYVAGAATAPMGQRREAGATNAIAGAVGGTVAPFVPTLPGRQIAQGVGMGGATYLQTGDIGQSAAAGLMGALTPAGPGKAAFRGGAATPAGPARTVPSASPEMAMPATEPVGGVRGTTATAEPEFVPVWSTSEPVDPALTGLAATSRPEPGGSMAEPMPGVTPGIGRPELANPGMTAEARNLVNQVDQTRKDAGIPEVRPDVQVQAEADAILQDRPAAKKMLLDRAQKGGIFTDAETVAAKRLVSDEAFLAIKSNDPAKMTEAMDLIDGYRVTGTEAARSLRARHDLLLTPQERMATFLGEAIFTPDSATQNKIKAASKSGKTEEANQLKADFAKKAQSLIKDLKKQGIDLSQMENIIGDRRKTYEAIRAIRGMKSGVNDVLYEYWINALLSGPKTQAANLVSNTANLAWDMSIQKLAESAINVLVRTPEASQFKDFPVLAKQFFPAIQRGFRNAWETYQTEFPKFEEQFGNNGHMESLNKVENAGHSIPGEAGRVIRTPTRALMAADDFNKTLAGHTQVFMEANRMARAEGLKGDALNNRIADLVEDFTSPAWDRAHAKAEALTFTEDPGKAINRLAQLRNELPMGGYFIPFLPTLFNIFRTGVRKSPLGSLALATRLANEGLVKIGAYQRGNMQYSKPRFVRDAAEQVIAWGGVMALQAALRDQDPSRPRITGTYPEGSATKGITSLKKEAVPSQSVLIGDQYYSYSRIEPFATKLAITVDMLNAYAAQKNGADAGKALAAVHQHMAQNIKDKTFAQGLADLIDLFTGDEKDVGKWASSFGASWVPNVVRQMGEATRDVVPQRRVWGGELLGDWGQRLAARTKDRALPFLENAPTPIIGIWGEPIEKKDFGSPVSDFLFRVLAPSDVVDLSQRDPVAVNLNRMILNWNAKNPNDQYSPATYSPEYSVKIPGKFSPQTSYMTDEQYQQFLMKGGSTARMVLGAVMGGADVENPSKEQMMMLQIGRDMSYAAAKAEMFGDDKAREMARILGEQYDSLSSQLASPAP